MIKRSKRLIKLRLRKLLLGAADKLRGPYNRTERTRKVGRARKKRRLTTRGTIRVRTLYNLPSMVVGESKSFAYKYWIRGYMVRKAKEYRITLDFTKAGNRLIVTRIA